jgi:hypothetical protein
MKKNSLSLYLLLSLCFGAALVMGLKHIPQARAAEEKTAVKVSEYASAEDLIAAQKYFLSQLEEPLANKAEYTEDLQERTKKTALILAVLAMNLGLHDTKNAAQTAAPLQYQLALNMAKNVKDFDAAKLSLDLLLQTQPEKPSPDKEKVQVYEGPALKWEMISGQGAMMKKTNELNSAIKRNLTPARFEKQLDALKYQTATMAAIGQATLMDKHEVKNHADLPTYEKYAIDFRTAAAELNKAVHAADQAAALKAFARMDTSCHTCHQKFDPPKK